MTRVTSYALLFRAAHIPHIQGSLQDKCPVVDHYIEIKLDQDAPSAEFTCLRKDLDTCAISTYMKRASCMTIISGFSRCAVEVPCRFSIVPGYKCTLMFWHVLSLEILLDVLFYPRNLSISRNV